MGAGCNNKLLDFFQNWHFKIIWRTTDTSYREPLFIDILVEDKVLVEVKATEKNHPIYETQVLTYLRLPGIKLGLLVNCGATYVKDVVSRILNGIL